MFLTIRPTQVVLEVVPWEKRWEEFRQLVEVKEFAFYGKHCFHPIYKVKGNETRGNFDRGLVCL
jgi:hypothetical protein